MIFLDLMTITDNETTLLSKIVLRTSELKVKMSLALWTYEGKTLF